MDPRHRGHCAFVVIVALVLSACGTTDPTSRPTLASSTAESTPPPTLAAATGTPAPVVQSTPTPTPAPTPTPTSTAAAGWTQPSRVGPATGCSTISAGIDSASRHHVAAECGGNIHYFVSTGGGPWIATVFTHPAHRQDLDPQIAFRGNVVYVAYSRIAIQDGGCGYDGTRDVGVYVQSRSQPDGGWSAPMRVGSPNDRLDSFRVDGETIHAIVNGGAEYEMLDGATLHRYPVPKASGPGEPQHAPFDGTSLRIGSDGRARIAYVADGGLRYSVFNGSGFSTARIPGTTVRDLAPRLALDADNHAHVVWTRIPIPDPGAGCATGDGPRPKDHGTYYATNASGTWQTHRITPGLGETSLQVDQATGRVHVVVSGKTLRYYTTAGDGTWSASTVTAAAASSPLLRLDPATGTLLVVYLGGPGGTRIYSLTKP